MAGAARHRGQVNDGVGRAAHRHRAGDAVVEVGAREQLGRRQVFPDHLHDTAATFGAHADVIRIRRGDGRRAGQREADGFGDAHHRRRRAHRHAGAVAACDAGFYLEPCLVAQAARTPFIPILEGVAARAEHFAAPVAAQHRAGRQVDERNAHRQRVHRQPGRGFVAAAHQHRAIDRVRAQQLFRFHGEEVAIEHRRRLDQALGQADGRQIERKATRLKHAALDVIDALLEVRVALVGVALGVDDRNHRLADPLFVRIAHLQHARAVAEGVEVVGREPARASKVGSSLHSSVRW